MILYAFAVEPRHDLATFERYLQDHPQLADELLEFFAEIRAGFRLGLSAIGNTPLWDREVAWERRDLRRKYPAWPRIDGSI